MSKTRDRLESHVASHPGVHFNELERALDLATGQVQYHLRHLQDEGRVIAEQLYGRTHYYPDEYDVWEREALALLRRETSSDIVALLLRDGPTSSQAVAQELDIARSTLSWHLDRLVEQEVVVKRRSNGRSIQLAVEEPERVVALLREADPAISERLVDRFTRLVDQLLTE